MARRNLLIRRLPDADGNLVTYLPGCEIERLVGVSSHTVSRWAKCGILRTTNAIQGARNYALVDAVKIRVTPVKESLALGIVRTPADELRATKEWFDNEQEVTTPKARNLRQPWDEYDIQLVASAFAADVPCETIALTLGRTYSAVLNMIDRIKTEGDLPRAQRLDAMWFDRSLLLLTPDERVEVQARRTQVAA